MRSKVSTSQRAGAVSIPEDPVARLRDVEPVGAPAHGCRRSEDAAPRAGHRLAEGGDPDEGTPTATSVCGWPPSPAKVAELSGGNIQRVILTRELGHESTLVVAMYPSRGLDIANTRRTQEILVEHRSRGAGVLVVSEDLDELMSIADRIVVMHDGHVSGVVDAADFERQALGQLMVGGAA